MASIERVLPPPIDDELTYDPIVDGGAPPPTFPEFTPVFPPPPVGSEEISVDPVVVMGTGGATLDLIRELGDNPIVFPDFSTTFPEPPVSIQPGLGPPNMITTTPPVTVG